MKFYSTNNRSVRVSLKEAVLEGLAPDNGLYMPVTIPTLPESFFSDLSNKSFQQIGVDVAKNIVGDDLTQGEIEKIVAHTIQFDAPSWRLRKIFTRLNYFMAQRWRSKILGRVFYQAC